ncbi:MAG: DUF3343 domain-containing protein [Candidatus Riflebacteria bacterium]|nr:DUF3343 domain-containing protein [Candidatus Riflebacteria bacterium]
MSSNLDLHDDAFVVFLFQSITSTLKAEKILKNTNIPHKLIPVPRHLSSDCGVCLRIDKNQRENVILVLKGFVEWEKEEVL